MTPLLSTPQFWIFAAAALLMAVTPGPNMIYLISRTLCQGRRAGVLSWCGVVLGFSVHMLCASVGLTALFMAVPMGYELLKFAGALYLIWLAWQAVRPGARSPLEAKDLPPEPPRTLFVMGLLTSILNPKVAIFYLSVLPQFIAPESGSVMAQSLLLGCTQVFIGSSVNLLVTLSAAAMARWFAQHRLWLAIQRYVMGLVLGALAVRLLSQQRSAT
nr:LysE family translocator [uncultured Rhodoferax sp.]